MSTYIWGKIKFSPNIPTDIRNYQKADILIYFSKKKGSSLYMVNLEENELYFNIACGYEEMIPQHEKYCLNCDEQYFSLNCPKREKNLEPYFNELHNRIKRLQDVITGIYERPEVEKITYFHTDTGNESSIDEYEVVNWKLQEFADKFFEAMNGIYVFPPTIKVVFAK